MLHSIYDQRDAPSVQAGFDCVITALKTTLLDVADHFRTGPSDVTAFTAFPKEIWRRIWSNNP